MYSVKNELNYVSHVPFSSSEVHDNCGGGLFKLFPELVFLVFSAQKVYIIFIIVARSLVTFQTLTVYRLLHFINSR